jgi:hypothetical protein
VPANSPLRISPAALPASTTEALHDVRDNPTSPASKAAEPLLLTPREAARALAISERSLWSLTASGEVRCVRLGRAKRYAPADLRNYIDRLRSAAELKSVGV